MSQVEPGGPLVIEVGERPLFELLGALLVLGHQPRIADGAHFARSHAPRGNGLPDAPRPLVGDRRSGRRASVLAVPRGAWDRGRRIDVSGPGAIERAGEFEDFLAGPLGRIEPVGPQPIELAGRLANRLPLVVGRLGEGEVWKQTTARAQAPS